MRIRTAWYLKAYILNPTRERTVPRLVLHVSKLLFYLHIKEKLTVAEGPVGETRRGPFDPDTCPPSAARSAAKASCGMNLLPLF